MGRGIHVETYAPAGTSVGIMLKSLATQQWWDFTAAAFVASPTANSAQAVTPSADLHNYFTAELTPWAANPAWAAGDYVQLIVDISSGPPFTLLGPPGIFTLFNGDDGGLHLLPEYVHGGAPPVTPTMEQALMLLYMHERNQLSSARTGLAGGTTAGAVTITNDAGTAIFSSGTTDDGTTFTRTKLGVA